MTAIVMYCQPCGKPISPGTGFIGVRHADIRSAQASESAPEAMWVTRHHVCSEAADGECYQIDAERITTWAAVTWWTAHLMAKSWLAATNWDVVLSELADGNPSGLLVAVQERAA